MTDPSAEAAKKARKNRNKELIKKMRDGDPLLAFDSKTSWFPPRPIIKKDDKEIEKIYGDKDNRKKSNKKKLTLVP